MYPPDHHTKLVLQTYKHTIICPCAQSLKIWCGVEGWSEELWCPAQSPDSDLVTLNTFGMSCNCVKYYNSSEIHCKEG